MISESALIGSARGWGFLQLRALFAANDVSALQGVDIPSLTGLAQQQQVAPFLFWKLGALGVDVNAPEWAALQDAYQKACARNLEFQSAALAIHDALEQARIPAIWLKGFALAHSVYPASELRPMLDLDVLVPFAQRHAALECLQRIGYKMDIVRPSESLQELSHDFHLIGAAPVELHYRLMGVHSKFFTADDLNWFWTQARPFAFQDRTLQMFAPEAQVLHLCAHAILNHTEAEFFLVRFLDLHLVITSTFGFNWNVVLERAVALRWTYAVERALDLTRTYFGTPIPDTILDALADRQPADEDNARAAHNHGQATALENTLNYLRGMTLREKFHWVRDSVFPSREYMQWRYHPQSRGQMAMAYPRRWFSIARNVVQTAFKRG